MRNDYTHITVILDRSGSMESIRDDTIGGFNAFLSDQKLSPGYATLTLAQFDGKDPYEVIYDFKPIDEIPELTRSTFVPRANTPLLDALGRGINDLERRLASIEHDERPARVIFVIITDGRENASREFHKDQIKKMIKEKSENAGWRFMFLSADLDAISDAKALGIAPNATLAFDKTSRGTIEAWASASLQTSRFRTGASKEPSFAEDHDDSRQKSMKDGESQQDKPDMDTQSRQLDLWSKES